MKRTLLILTLCSLIFGCGKFREGTINYVDFPGHDPRVAATLIFSDEADSLVAFITNSASVTDPNGPQTIEGTIISLKDENGNLIYEIDPSHLQDSLYIMDLVGQVEIPEGEIYLEVYTNLEPVVSAQTRMPSKSEIVGDFYLGYDTAMFWGFEYIRDRYEISIDQDPTIVENYMVYLDYKFEIKPGVASDWRTVWVEDELDTRMTPILSQDGILIKDETVAADPNGLHNIVFYTENRDKRNVVARRIRVESISSELESYYMSLEEFENQNLFAEPDLIYSNVSTGFGCFGLYSYQEIRF